MKVDSSRFSEVERAVLDSPLIAGVTCVLAACSGGADSIALLSALWELKEILKIRVSAAHANHKIRGEESDEDQAFVRRFCSERGIELTVRTLDLSGSGNLEERARIARYNFLAGEAAGRGAVVATGHNLDDQAETFLMKLIRGAGPGGLSGIAGSRFHRDPQTGAVVRVIRPLLEVGRGRIIDYLDSKGLSYRTDRTNLDASFDRNWVRRELIPLIEERLNPRAREALVRTTGLMREVDDDLDRRAAEYLAGARVTQGMAALPIAGLSRLAPPVRKTAIRQAIEVVRGSLHDLTLGHVEAVLDLAEGASGRRVSLPGELSAIREFGELRLTLGPWPEPFETEIDLPGEAVFPALGKRVRVEPDQDRPGSIRLLSSRLRIRSRLPGDRFRPGPNGPSKKLKKHFQERRVPVSERDRLLVFESAGTVVWVEGFPPPREAVEAECGTWYRITVETFQAQAPSNR